MEETETVNMMICQFIFLNKWTVEALEEYIEFNQFFKQCSVYKYSFSSLISQVQFILFILFHSIPFYFFLFYSQYTSYVPRSNGVAIVVF